MTMTMPTTSASRPGSSEFRPPRFASPLRLLPNGKPYPTHGPTVRRWIERTLVHGEGDYFGQPWRCEPFQRYILDRLYEYDPTSGRRLYSKALIGIPKGNAKTELAAAIGLAELGGPVAPLSPNVPVSAASFDQANKLFGAARTMIEEGPLRPYFETFETEIQRRDGPGIMERVAAVAGTNDGGLPTVHLADELHEWIAERTERVFLVIGNSLRKRSDGLQLAITTAGDDKDTLLGRLYEHGTKVASGETVDERFLFLWWEADPKWKLSDPDQLRSAILEANPAAGSFLPIQGLLERYADPEVAEHEFNRYHLNRWDSPPQRWISADLWNACAATYDQPPPPGTPIAIGFDGSATRDNTGFVGCTIPTGDEKPRLFRIGLWERDPRDPHWHVPRGEVSATLAQAIGTWDVRRVQCDPAGWRTEIDDWATEFGSHLILDVPQTNERMAPMCDAFRADVLAKQIEHDGDAALARNVTNAHTRLTRWGLAIRKDHPDSPRKIDLAIAAVLARDGAVSGHEQPSVYESRGIQII